MRQPAPVSRPVALTIAGSDSGGGAGIQADLKTMEATGAFATSVVTAVTAQNTQGVRSSYVLPRDEIRAQLDAVTEDFAVAAVKTGMLATAEVVELVADFAAGYDGPLVVDPVMVATSGDRLLSEDAEAAYEALIGEATLVTPNVDEAAVLTGVEVGGEATAREAGEALLAMGCDAALIKGGHVAEGPVVTDWLVTPERAEPFRHARVGTDATHGSGCTLSSAIAAELAQGASLPAAVKAGTDLLARAVRYHHAVGTGPGAVHHLVDLRDRAEREPTATALGEAVRALVEADIAPLVPDDGLAVVAATPYADSPDHVATLDGRITTGTAGLVAPDAVRFGAHDGAGRALLAGREDDAGRRFAAVCRETDAVKDALPDFDWATETVVGHDRTTVFAPDGETLVARLTALADAL